MQCVTNVPRLCKNNPFGNASLLSHDKHPSAEVIVCACTYLAQPALESLLSQQRFPLSEPNDIIKINIIPVGD